MIGLRQQLLPGGHGANKNKNMGGWLHRTRFHVYASHLTTRAGGNERRRSCTKMLLTTCLACRFRPHCGMRTGTSMWIALLKIVYRRCGVRGWQASCGRLKKENKK